MSACLMALGIFAFVMITTGIANLGIDFAGGGMLQGHFEEPVSIDDLRSVLTTEFDNVQVTEITDFEAPNAFIIKTKRPESEAEGKERADALKAKVAEGLRLRTRSESRAGRLAVCMSPRISQAVPRRNRRRAGLRLSLGLP